MGDLLQNNWQGKWRWWSLNEASLTQNLKKSKLKSTSFWWRAGLKFPFRQNRHKRPERVDGYRRIVMRQWNGFKRSRSPGESSNRHNEPVRLSMAENDLAKTGASRLRKWNTYRNSAWTLKQTDERWGLEKRCWGPWARRRLEELWRSAIWMFGSSVRNEQGQLLSRVWIFRGEEDKQRLVRDYNPKCEEEVTLNNSEENEPVHLFMKLKGKQLRTVCVARQGH